MKMFLMISFILFQFNAVAQKNNYKTLNKNTYSTFEIKNDSVFFIYSAFPLKKDSDSTMYGYWHQIIRIAISKKQLERDSVFLFNDTSLQIKSEVFYSGMWYDGYKPYRNVFTQINIIKKQRKEIYLKLNIKAKLYSNSPDEMLSDNEIVVFSKGKHIFYRYLKKIHYIEN